MFPKGFKARPHTHSVTERFMIVGGSSTFAHGDTWTDKELKPLAMGAIGVLPKEHAHCARAGADGVVVQVSGVGPFDMKWSHAEDAPTNRAP